MWKIVYIKYRFKHKYFQWFYPSPLLVYLISAPLFTFLPIFPAILPWFVAPPLHFPHSHPDFLHSTHSHSGFSYPHPESPHSHLHFHPNSLQSPHFHSHSPCCFHSNPHFPHSPHSVSWCSIQTFTDSHFMLLTQYHLLISKNWIY